MELKINEKILAEQYMNEYLSNFRFIDFYIKKLEQVPNLEILEELEKSINIEEKNFYYHKSRFKSLLKEIQKLPLNYDFVLIYLSYYRLNKDWSLATCIKNTAIFIKYNDLIDYRNFSYPEIFRIYTRIKKSKLSQSTKSTEWRVMKQFFKFAGFNKDLSELSIKEPKNVKKPKDILTKEEFEMIIDGLGKHKSGKGLEYQTFFTLIADTGIRTGEAFSVNKKSLIKKKGIYQTFVSGKTGDRTVILHNSSLYFDKLIGEGWDKWTFTYNAFRKYLKNVCDKKNITKRVYNHLLRHNFGSYIASDSRVSPEIRKTYGGWSKSSKVFEETYVHFNNKEVIEKMELTLKENPLF